MAEKTIRLRIRAVPQSDDRGCGYFALSAVYKYYGLSPRSMDLRDLLGTDHALPYGFPGRRDIEKRLKSKLKGTWPQDIFAVLFRHGFQARIAPVDFGEFRRGLRRHLGRGHPAVALVDNGAHWVVVSGIGPDGVWIVDSCYSEDEDDRLRHVYFLSDDEYLERRVGEIFVSRWKNATERPMSPADFAREYLRGTQFGARFLGRKAVQWLTEKLSFR